VFRQAALRALGSTGRMDVATWALDLADPRLRPQERVGILATLVLTSETHDVAATRILADYDKLAAGNGIFLTSRLPSILGTSCSVERAAELEAQLGPKVRKVGVGVLDFQRSVESIRRCGVLKTARGAELAAALKGE
jgi:hypothetical protein